MTENIKQADQADLDGILGWLKVEYDDGEQHEERGLYGNRKVIEKHFAEENLFVYLNGTGLPIGFITGPVWGPDILSIAPDYRGQGYGSKLAQFMISKARHEGYCAINVECATQGALGFWLRQGFELGKHRPSDGGSYDSIYNWLFLDYPHSLPEGQEVQVSIDFYLKGQEADLQDPAKTQALKAVLAEDGVVYLSARAFFAPGFYGENDSAAWLGVSYGGKSVFLGSASSPAASELGVKKSWHGFYLDQIQLLGQ